MFIVWRKIGKDRWGRILKPRTSNRKSYVRSNDPFNKTRITQKKIFLVMHSRSRSGTTYPINRE